VTRDALVLCAGTIPRATFRERIAAARAGGFDGISLRLGDYARARAEGLSDDDMRALLAGEGLAVAEIEALTAWRPGATPARPEHAELRVLAVAEAMRARSISVVEGPGAPVPVDAAAEAFVALCDRAAARGLLVHIEFWPGSALDLATAAAVIAKADRPNGGLLVDTWHLARTRGGTALLEGIPGTHIGAVQISDSPRVDEPEADYLAAALTRRLLPGDGSLDLVGFLRLLETRGSPAPIGVEICSAQLAAEPPDIVARRAGDAIRTLVAAARREHDHGSPGSGPTSGGAGTVHLRRGARARYEDGT
jgi:sugar phosphate isomerase/epimerase